MKTHRKILEETESHFFAALIACDVSTLHGIMDLDFVYSDETGEIFKGLSGQPMLNTEILCVGSIEIIERHMTLFNNVGMVISLESRTGQYLGTAFDNTYRITRVWKFNGRKWILVGSVASML